jgi:hypothetical protein
MTGRLRRPATAQRRGLSLARELRVLNSFIGVYCCAQHGAQPSGLCPECAGLLDYAAGRLKRCPYDPKPKCKRCPTHCYAPAQRERMRQVMRFSGMWYIKRGRLDWLVRYFLL